MAYEQLTRGDLRALALTFATGSDSNNRWGGRVNTWLNEGLRRFWQGQYGVEDVITFTTTAGQREYPLPQGMLYPRLLLCNGLPIEYREMRDQDYYAAGNSRPGWYTPYGPYIYLGPQAPDGEYQMKFFFTRAPYPMTGDAQEPELPPMWRTSIAKYAAGMIALAERDLQQAQALLQEFAFEKKDFEEYKTMKTLDNFLKVGNPYQY